MHKSIAIIDRIAAELGVSAEARKKWRQRGRVSDRMRTPILHAAKSQGIEIELAAFDAFRAAKKNGGAAPDSEAA